MSGWFTLALGWWFYGRLRQEWRRRRYGEPLDHEALLAKYSRLMTGAIDQQAIRQLLTEALPPAFQADRAVLLRLLAHQLVDVANGNVRLPDDTAVAAFRIAQEALRNAIQHADASEIEVRLTSYPDYLRLTVTDDGRGIAGGVEPRRFVAQGHLGLAGMRERAAMIGGKVEVQSAPDYGTVVVLELPL